MPFPFGGRGIRFLQRVAITSADHRFALAQGSTKLEALLQRHAYLIPRDVNRPSVGQEANQRGAPETSPTEPLADSERHRPAVLTR